MQQVGPGGAIICQWLMDGSSRPWEERGFPSKPATIKYNGSHFQMQKVLHHVNGAFLMSNTGVWPTESRKRAQSLTDMESSFAFLVRIGRPGECRGGGAGMSRPRRRVRYRILTATQCNHVLWVTRLGSRENSRHV